jgi:hypothetical protein
MSVVVFNGRPLGLTGNLTLAESNFDGYDPAIPVSEVSYYIANNALGLTNIIRVRYEYFNHSAPSVRSGDWVLDLSLVRGEPHAYFYRVAGTKEGVEIFGGTPYQYVDFEVQQPLRGFTPPAPTPFMIPAFPAQLPGYADPFIGQPSALYPNDRARLLVIDGVAEVFERGVGKAP